VYVLISITH